MNFINLKFLRIFIFLLTTVFLTDTVYASGMMVADQLCANHTVTAVEYSHDGYDMDQHDHHKHDNDHKQSANDHCSKCGHCMACFTILPPSQLADLQSQVKAIEVSLFEPVYHSHISTQPQRPPIS